VVGAHDSGCEIALDIVSRQPTLLSGRDTGHVPFRVDSAIGRFVGVPLVMFMFHRVLALNTPIGRRMRPKALQILHHAGPVVRVKPKDIAAAGIERVPRVVGVRDGHPVLEDERKLEVTNVIWCTGYHHDFPWIDLPIFEEEGPMHDRGVVASEPGLYFVGLWFLYAGSSALLRGVGRDAERIVRGIGSRVT
jgi:putative flavoprotein involved in K+ transport